MRAKKGMGTIAIGILCLVGLWSSAVRAENNADDPEKKAVVAVQSPMEIPGTVLQPGSYVFKQSGAHAGWVIVQIYDQRESTLVTTVLAYPNPKLTSNSETVMTYSAPGSSGQVLEAVTFPGDAMPDQFAYPAAEADRIGAANRLRIPTTGTNDAYPSSLPEAAASWSAPLSNSVRSTPIQTAAASTDTSLPQTASSLPLVGLIGVFALAAIFALRKLGTAKS
ncbi:MAG: hypothetical protein WA823_18855 [Candidatus Acidiferrales bacterium]